MSVGPILIFDKSTLQSLTVDESVWLDAFYLPSITPLFFIETLADLDKALAGGRTPEEVVGNLAEKTPTGAMPNAHHTKLCVANLLGEAIAMDGRVVLAGGRHLTTGDRRGLIFEPAPEREALIRWGEGRFFDIERRFAREWRRALTRLDLAASSARLIGGPRIRDHADAKSAAGELVRQDGQRYAVLRFALDSLQVPSSLSRDILCRWKGEGGPRLVDFAPYAAYVTTVNLCFALAIGASLESSGRPSHQIDLAYLYYLPFCYVFTSNDRLHERLAPLFLRSDQAFVKGADLKRDLGKLNDYYSALPPEVRERGVMSFAHYPPVDGKFLTAQLWDRFMRSEWREWARKPPMKLSPERERELVEMVNRMKKEGRPTEPFGADEADELQVQHKVPMRKGSWRLLPPDVGRNTER